MIQAHKHTSTQTSSQQTSTATQVGTSNYGRRKNGADKLKRKASQQLLKYPRGVPGSSLKCVGECRKGNAAEKVTSLAWSKASVKALFIFTRRVANWRFTVLTVTWASNIFCFLLDCWSPSSSDESASSCFLEPLDNAEATKLACVLI